MGNQTPPNPPRLNLTNTHFYPLNRCDFVAIIVFKTASKLLQKYLMPYRILCIFKCKGYDSILFTRGITCIAVDNHVPSSIYLNEVPSESGCGHVAAECQRTPLVRNKVSALHIIWD